MLMYVCAAWSCQNFEQKQHCISCCAAYRLPEMPTARHFLMKIPLYLFAVTVTFSLWPLFSTSDPVIFFFTIFTYLSLYTYKYFYMFCRKVISVLVKYRHYLIETDNSHCLKNVILFF